MTTDTLARKRLFMHNLHANDFESHGVSVITQYLQEVYLVKTPQNFPQQLCTANYNHTWHEKDISLSFKTLDSIIESCEKWRPYLLDQASFDLLVCEEVKSMAGIHASVIAARNFHERQGAVGVHLKEDVSIPPLFTTVVSYYGLLQVFS